jgi:hypothetical protein
MEVERLQAVLEAAGLAGFKASMEQADRVTDSTKRNLGGIAAASEIATKALRDVKMVTSQALESRATAQSILDGVRGIGEEARQAARKLDDVHLAEAQAIESKIAAAEISSGLNEVSRNADEAKRKLVEVRLAGRGSGPFRTTGAGVGPFGSGFGRIGVLGTAIGAGVLTAPAVAPAALGAIASVPTLAAGGGGALTTLALAFDGVGKAIGGDKKAFDELTSSQRAFVLEVRSLSGWLDKLKQTAAGSLFPGLTKGLNEALSPGTVGAITTAVAQFGHAIGAAGEQWGKYFGSSQFQSLFGPLMKAGAQTFTVMSDAALHLFDALGVLGRAAIPLTSWITRGIDAGSRLADSWLRAKDASGGLAHAMAEAHSSVQLVGRLLVAVSRAVYALGAALYPVSRVAVKELTNGFNSLASIISHNQATIRELIGGALTALVGAVKIASLGVSAFVGVLQRLVGEKAPLVAMLTAIGAVMALTLGPEGTAIVAAVAGIGYLQQQWLGFNKFFAGLWKGLQGIVELGVYGQLAAFSELFKGLAGAAGHIPVIGGKIKHGLEDAAGFIDKFKTLGEANLKAARTDVGAAFAAGFKGGNGGFLGLKDAVNTATGSAITNAALNPVASLPEVIKRTNEPFDKNLGPKPPKPSPLDRVFPPRLQAQLERAQTAFESAGTPRAAGRFVETAKKMLDYLNAEHATGKQLVALERERRTITNEILSARKKMAELPASLANNLATARSNISGGTLQQESQYLALAKKALDYLQEQRKAGADLNTILRERRQITEGIEKAEKRVHDLQVTGKQEKILGIGAGSVAGAASLKAQTRNVLVQELARVMKPVGPHVRGAAASAAAHLPASALHATPTQLVRLIEQHGVELPKSTLTSLQKIQQVLEMSLKEHTKLSDAVSENVAARLSQIRDTLKNLHTTAGGNVRPVTAEKLLKGVKFASPAAKKEAQQRLDAALALGGKVPTGPTALGIPVGAPAGGGRMGHAPAVYSGAITIKIDARDQDPKQIAREIRQELDKHAARNGVQYRGRHAGR